MSNLLEFDLMLESIEFFFVGRLCLMFGFIVIFCVGATHFHPPRNFLRRCNPYSPAEMPWGHISGQKIIIDILDAAFHELVSDVWELWP